MSEEARHTADGDTLGDNLSSLERLLEQMRHRDGEDRHLLYEQALELVHACQSLIEEGEEPA